MAQKILHVSQEESPCKNKCKAQCRNSHHVLFLFSFGYKRHNQNKIIIYDSIIYHFQVYLYSLFSPPEDLLNVFFLNR